MATKTELSVGLFEPGMTHLHRVGLAGLYMSLALLRDDGGIPKGLECGLDARRVTLRWSDKGKNLLDDLFRASFGITKEGLLDFAAHRGLGLGDLQRIELTRALLSTYLQHNKQNMIPGGTSKRTRSLSLGDDQVLVEYRPFVKPYAHCSAASSLFTAKGSLKKVLKLKGWLVPGAAKRHSGLSGTEITAAPKEFLCLLFAPVASLYFHLFHRGPDGKTDMRRGTAICLPHVTDLAAYSRSYARYLTSPVERLSADGLDDAGLSAMLALKADDSLQDLGVTGCTVITMGAVVWNKQQKTRTGAVTFDKVDERMLDEFDLAVRLLPNRIVVKKEKGRKKDSATYNRYFVAPSPARGLIAENIAADREWFLGFSGLMRSKEHSKRIRYEKGGLKQMVEQFDRSHEEDRIFVEAVHTAVRNRYGALAARSKERGETIRFDREFERMRTGLMRAKNLQTLRAELADLFARGGINKTLQAEWKRILSLFTGPDWQRTRDLALLALASYAGKGVDEPESAHVGGKKEDKA